MVKKIFAVVLSAVFCLNMAVSAFAADAVKKTAPAPAAPAVTGVENAPKGAMPGPIKPTRHSTFSFLSGTVEKINTSDPEKQTIDIKNEKDGKIHTIDIAPVTNIIKVTDMSELKTGDSVRVMARMADDRETGISITFGKLRPIPAMPIKRAATVPAAKTTTAAPAKK